AHRGGLRARGGAHRRHVEPHHLRDHRPGLPRGQLLRRHRGRPRADDEADRWRVPAAARTRGAPRARPRRRRGAARPGRGGPAPVFGVLVGSVVLRGIFGRTLGSAFTGGGAGALVYLAGYALALAGLAAVAAFFITLVMGFAGTGSGWSSGRGGGFGGGWGG